jgi:hypothetical protein
MTLFCNAYQHLFFMYIFLWSQHRSKDRSTGQRWLRYKCLITGIFSRMVAFHPGGIALHGSEYITDDIR